MQSISTRFDDDILVRLDEVANAMDRPRSALIKEAVTRYLDYLSWHQGEIDKGIEDFNAGRTSSHDEVKGRVRGLGFHVD